MEALRLSLSAQYPEQPSQATAIRLAVLPHLLDTASPPLLPFLTCSQTPETPGALNSCPQ